MNPHEIKDLRKEKKLSQQELGEICGVSKAAVSNWEKSIRKPSGAALIILEELRDGKIIVSDVSELEVKLMDQNVQVGGFNNREDYLTQSLKYLLTHGGFMPLDQADQYTPLAVAEDPAVYNADEQFKIEENKPGGENSTAQQ